MFNRKVVACRRLDKDYMIGKIEEKFYLIV